MSSRKICLVDDDESYTRMVRTLLGIESHEVTVHADPKTAFSEIEAEMPDLVLLDLHVGEQDAGQRVLAALRAEERTRRIPVILCSGASHLSDLALDPLTERLQKPFDPDELVARVETLLSERASDAGNPQG